MQSGVGCADSPHPRCIMNATPCSRTRRRAAANRLVSPACRLVNRELVAWVPDPDDASDATMFGLEEAHTQGWDQFAVNQQKFGYRTGWNEDFYTVKLDKDKCGIDEATAARIAREIERGNTSNPHLAEERGQVVDDSGLDEEDKYSGVIRPEDLARMRAAQQQRGQQSAGAGSAAPQNGGPALAAKPAAWSRAGSGLSAVTGGARVGAGPPGAAGRHPPGQVGGGPRGGNSTPSPHPPGIGPPPPGVLPPTGAPASSAPVSIPVRSGASSGGGGGSAGGVAGSPAALVGSAPSSDIDPRREANKVRLSLTGTSLNRSSPYGTPKGGMRSPLQSPLISDPLKVAALNLEPGMTKVWGACGL
jgi:LsmAD domain